MPTVLIRGCGTGGDVANLKEENLAQISFLNKLLLKVDCFDALQLMCLKRMLSLK